MQLKNVCDILKKGLADRLDDGKGEVGNEKEFEKILSIVLISSMLLVIGAGCYNGCEYIKNTR